MGLRARRLIFGLILLLAAAFRLPRISGESLWADEILTTRSATVPFSKCLDVVRQIENAPPLYFVLMNRWVAVFGATDTSLRMPSALAGIAAIVVMFQLGRELFDKHNLGAAVGLWSAAMLAVQPYHVAYSMEARMYALMFLLALWSCLAMAILLQRRSRWAQVGYVLASAAMLWTHTMAAFVIVAQNLVIVPFLILRDRRAALAASTGPLNLRGWLILQATVLILMIPWLSEIRTVWEAGAPWIGKTTIARVIEEQAASLGLTIVWVILACVAIALGWRSWVVWFALALWLVPLLVPAMLSTRSKSILLTRYAIPAMIGIHLLCGFAAAELAKRKWWLGAAGAVAIAAGLIISIPLLANGHTLQQPHRPDIRSAARTVAGTAQAGDLVYSDAAAFDYYCRRSDLVRIRDDSLVSTIQPAPARIWFVQYADQQTPLVTGFVMKQTWSYDGVRLDELEKQP